MRTFVLRSRKGSTRWDRFRSQVGGKAHVEVIAHSIINAFFISSDFRSDVEVYVVLDSSESYPHTIRLSSAEGLSLPGFHETAILELLERVLKKSQGLNKDETRKIEAGIEVSAFGFDKLLSQLIKNRTLYLLDPKGEDIRHISLDPHPVFVLSDHLAMPKKVMDSFKRKGLKSISLGKKMLFASQCIVLINHEMD